MTINVSHIIINNIRIKNNSPVSPVLRVVKERSSPKASLHSPEAFSLKWYVVPGNRLLTWILTLSGAHIRNCRVERLNRLSILIRFPQIESYNCFLTMEPSTLPFSIAPSELINDAGSVTASGGGSSHSLFGIPSGQEQLLLPGGSTNIRMI